MKDTKDLIIKKLIRRNLQNILDDEMVNKEDNSLIFLESQSLNLLFMYLLLNMEEKNKEILDSHYKENYKEDFDELIQEIEYLKKKQEETFEEIIKLLNNNF